MKFLISTIGELPNLILSHSPSFLIIMARKIEQQMNEAILNRKDWHKANTRVEYEQGNCISRVYLHGNKIAEVGDNFIRLFDGGWRSVTTKSRLNAILRGNGNGTEGVYQRNYQWYISHDGTEEEFVSGMILY